jgi:uncharacterized protein YcaQ
MSVPVLPNAAARRVFLHAHLLSGLEAGNGRGADLLSVIRRLGFVQLDSINTVARAHDLILFSRRPSYRPRNLELLLERDRSVFEHWTHDAAVIPTEFRPHWQLKCTQDAARLRRMYKKWQRHEFEHLLDTVMDKVRDCGPVCSADLASGLDRKNEGWWDWHPEKTALEFLWRSGRLSVDRRVAFRKFYDLSERVLPADALNAPDCETVDWACANALERLGFATPGELAAFWDMISPAQAKEWAIHAKASGRVIDVDVEGVDGRLRRSLAYPQVMEFDPPEPTGRIRVLSPFDPALRDRNRAARLFGFSYRIEIFVPEAKRKYGYYVFPLLEGARLVGRIDMKADRRKGNATLRVTRLWPEKGVRFGKGRLARLNSELERVSRFAGCEQVDYAPRWLTAS